MKVLLVEDEEMYASLVRDGLRLAGLTVELATDGREGLAVASTETFDAIILDINLPGLDGLTILSRLRSRGVATPVLMLTARGELNERVEGLQKGADDYLTKPFFVEELHARILALVRRAAGQPSPVYRVSGLVLDPHRRSASHEGTDLPLTQREFALLELLVRSPGRVFSKAHIGQHVWDSGIDVGTNMIDIAMSRLRKKLAAAGADGLIHTRRGLGYVLKEAPQ